jgi:lysozyme family protein
MTDDEILDDIIRREGGFVNHPADSGGPTNFGITQATLAAFRKQPVTAADVEALTVDEAKEIYRAKYLMPFQNEDEGLRPQLVDIAVNSGVLAAQRLLVAARANHGTRPVGVQLTIERLKFYADIVRRRPSQSVFIAGWVNRAVEFL